MLTITPLTCAQSEIQKTQPQKKLTSIPARSVESNVLLWGVSSCTMCVHVRLGCAWDWEAPARGGYSLGGEREAKGIIARGSLCARPATAPRAVGSAPGAVSRWKAGRSTGSQRSPFLAPTLPHPHKCPSVKSSWAEGGRLCQLCCVQMPSAQGTTVAGFHVAR